MSRNKQEFWEQVAVRNKENAQIVRGGFAPSWAPLAALAGLHFFRVGLWVALLPTFWIWFYHYEWLMRLVREMIWR